MVVNRQASMLELHLNLCLLLMKVFCTLKIVFLLFKKTILAPATPVRVQTKVGVTLSDAEKDTTSRLTAAIVLCVSCV